MSDDANQPPTGEYGHPPVAGLEQFQSVKVVRAGEITEVVKHGCYVRDADGSAVFRGYHRNMTARFTPVAGDFWVVYEGDGYESLSPREAFTTGYVPLAHLGSSSGAKANQPPPTDAARDAAQDAEIEALAHAVQTGVAYVMEWDDKETSPKHLRVGINMALVSNAALAELLAAKGVCTIEEVKDFQIAALRREVASYEAMIQEHFGGETKITLA